MGQQSKIEWTEATWNPIRARRRSNGNVGWYCQKVSPGCANCYAEAMNLWRGNGIPYAMDKLKDVELFLDEKILLEPLKWRKPRMIFVCSMTDLFGEFVPKEFICEVLARMGEAQRHTFQVLTKRPARMKALLEDIQDFSGKRPPEHIWWGISVENQAMADERIPLLLQTPAALRWVSYEPALGPVDFSQWLTGCEDHGIDLDRPVGSRVGCCIGWMPPLDWLVVGGESGPKARPFDLAWARSAVRQCREAGVAVFVKQLGSHPVVKIPRSECFGYWPVKLLNRKGGDPSEWLKDLRVREWPKFA